MIDMRPDAGLSYTPAQLDNRMLSDQVGSFLLREIASGKVRQGHRINEAELARHLGISRNPIREALRRLEERGLLVSVPRRGTFVRTFTRKDIDDIFSFRDVVETFALEQGLPRMTEADLDGIAGHVRTMADAAESGDETAMVESDLAFHRAIVGLSGNHQTRHAFANIETELLLLLTMAEQGFESLEALAADHWPVVEALGTGHIGHAVQAIHDHIDDSWRRIAEGFGQRAPRTTMQNEPGETP